MTCRAVKKRAPCAVDAVIVHTPLLLVPRQALELAAHVDSAALRLHLGCSRVPHHARTLARILEALDQRLDDLVALLRSGARADRAAQSVRHGAPQVETLDALRGPVGGNLVARHAPHLLGVGLEEDREQPVAELVRHPFAEVLGVRRWGTPSCRRTTARTSCSRRRPGCSRPRTPSAGRSSACRRSRCGRGAGAR